MLDIYNAFEPGIFVVDCLIGEGDCHRADKCAAKVFWNKLNMQITDTFTKTTLADLVKTHKKLNKIKVKAETPIIN
jgi:DNA-binding IscR family transcriptional regulator